MRIVQANIRSVNYLQLDLSTLFIGDATAFNIYIKKNDGYVIIIEAGTILSEKMYAKLEKQEKLYIYKDDKNKLTLNCDSLKFYVKFNKDNIQKRMEYIYKISDILFNDYMEHPFNKIEYRCVNSIVKAVIFLIKYDKDFLKNTIPHFEQEHKLSNHSLHVTVYATFLGNLLGLKSKELLQLGIAALLHDLGIKKIDQKLINKNGELTENEQKEVSKHSRLSVEIIKLNYIQDSTIIEAVLHHHEQYDGYGYPDRLMEKDITIFASILSICDVFDALTSHRPYRKHFSSFEALRMMLKDESMANNFNRRYLHLLLKSL